MIKAEKTAEEMVVNWEIKVSVYPDCSSTM